MNFESLKNFLTSPSLEAKPSDLEIALARIHTDHTAAMVAIKLLTEAVQSNAAGNLDMTVVHEERHKDIIKTLRELKKEVSTAESCHLTAFEIALRPVLRAVEELDKKLTNKFSAMDADIRALRVDLNYDRLNYDREAQAHIQNTKLNAIAERIDSLVKILAKDLIKHPEGVTVAPPKKKQGRRTGDKNRTPEQRYLFLKHRVKVAHPGGEAQKKWQRLLTEFCNRTGMGE
jgi:hypothetical protein